MNPSLLDTSFLIFLFQHPSQAENMLPPGKSAVSTMSLAELYHGVQVAKTQAFHNERKRFLVAIQRIFKVIPIDVEVASAFGLLTASARHRSCKPTTADTLIAATGLAYGLSIYTLDKGFRVFSEVESVIIDVGSLEN